MPTGERAAKAAQVKALLGQHRALAAMVSCRELDYTGALSLDLDTVSIRPLDPPRILDFVTAYLMAALAPGEDDPTMRETTGRARGEDLFWRLGGGEDVRQAWKTWEAAGASLSLFWSATGIPRVDPDVSSCTSAAMNRAWEQAVRDPRGLMRLAGNPYLLLMLTRVYLDSGDVPQNRAALFDRFVTVVLRREGLAEVTTAEDAKLQLTPDGERVMKALEGLALTMQSRSTRVIELYWAAARYAVDCSDLTLTDRFIRKYRDVDSALSAGDDSLTAKALDRSEADECLDILPRVDRRTRRDLANEGATGRENGVPPSRRPNRAVRRTQRRSGDFRQLFGQRPPTRRPPGRRSGARRPYLLARHQRHPRRRRVGIGGLVANGSKFCAGSDQGTILPLPWGARQPHPSCYTW
jgi:hypothetical protein